MSAYFLLYTQILHAYVYIYMYIHMYVLLSLFPCRESMWERLHVWRNNCWLQFAKEVLVPSVCFAVLLLPVLQFLLLRHQTLRTCIECTYICMCMCIYICRYTYYICASYGYASLCVCVYVCRVVRLSCVLVSCLAYCSGPQWRYVSLVRLLSSLVPTCSATFLGCCTTR